MAILLLFIKEKNNAMASLVNGKYNANLAFKSQVAHSNISTMWKNKDKIKDELNRVVN